MYEGGTHLGNFSAAWIHFPQSGDVFGINLACTWEWKEMTREIWNKGRNTLRIQMCFGFFWSSFLLLARSYLWWLLFPLSLHCRRITISSTWKDSAPENQDVTLFPLSSSSICYFSIPILFAAVLNSLGWTLAGGTISNCPLGCRIIGDISKKEKS